MKFEHYQMLKKQALEACEAEKIEYPKVKEINPVLLALIGDAVFSLYIRTRLLPVSSHVRIVHEMASKAVSAVMQAKVMHELEGTFTEEEEVIIRRGRNTKSIVPKSASVSEYRLSTAFETLLGWLLLSDKEERLEEIMEKAFKILATELKKR